MATQPSAPVGARSTLTPLARLQPIAASHPIVRRYSQVRRNVVPRHERVTVVSGRWAHEQLLALGVGSETTLWCPGEHPPPDLECLALQMAETSARCCSVSERTLARLHPGMTAPALLSIVGVRQWSRAQVLRPDARLLLVADGIEYAGNLGSLVRTADACGADGLVLTHADARLTHPKVFVASRGTVLTMPVLEYADVVEARQDLAAAGFTAYIADPAATTGYRDVDYSEGKSAIVVGSEGDGVCQDWRDGDLTRVSIPMLGRADSLNVAASAAILLFEARASLGS